MVAMGANTVFYVFMGSRLVYVTQRKGDRNSWTVPTASFGWHTIPLPTFTTLRKGFDLHLCRVYRHFKYPSVGLGPGLVKLTPSVDGLKSAATLKKFQVCIEALSKFIDRLGCF